MLMDLPIELVLRILGYRSTLQLSMAQVIWRMEWRFKISDVNSEFILNRTFTLLFDAILLANPSFAYPD